jgi:hypothetical protein
MVRGAKREGKEIEKGALMQQDTDGKIEITRLTTTNQKDEGVDYKIIVKDGFDFKEYYNNLKKSGNIKKKNKV